MPVGILRCCHGVGFSSQWLFVAFARVAIKAVGRIHGAMALRAMLRNSELEIELRSETVWRLLRLIELNFPLSTSVDSTDDGPTKRVEESPSPVEEIESVDSDTVASSPPSDDVDADDLLNNLFRMEKTQADTPHQLTPDECVAKLAMKLAGSGDDQLRTQKSPPGTVDYEFN